MNGERAPQASFGVRAAVLAASGMLLAGCGLVPDMPNVPNQPPAPAEHVYTLPPTGSEASPCAEPKPDDPHIKEKARRCEEMQAAGTVAIVSFDADPNRISAFSRIIPLKISDATGGKVHLTTTPMDASPTAKAALSYFEHGKDCVDTSDKAPLPARIADATMPELHKYDLVLAVTEQKACGTQAGQTSGRLVNAYVGKAGGNLNTAEAVVLHEVGHGVGENHRGTAGPLAPGHKVPNILNVYGYALGEPLDLKGYLGGAHGPVAFQEYSLGPNIMGTLGTPANVLPDSTQEALLDWPKAVLGQGSSIEQVGSKPVRISPEDAADNKVASVILDPPAKIVNVNTASADHPASRDFTKLIIEPRVYGSDMSNVETFVDLQLVDKDHATVDLGTFLQPQGINGGTSVISYGEQHIKVGVHRGTTTVQMMQQPAK